LGVQYLKIAIKAMSDAKNISLLAKKAFETSLKINFSTILR